MDVPSQTTGQLVPPVNPSPCTVAHKPVVQSATSTYVDFPIVPSCPQRSLISPDTRPTQTYLLDFGFTPLQDLGPSTALPKGPLAVLSVETTNFSTNHVKLSSSLEVIDATRHLTSLMAAPVSALVPDFLTPAFIQSTTLTPQRLHR
ncbi:hypothetical protein CSKR_201843 [Clonorchis sinensis]|uniref:Uncharacterized protein n=1 Tax=Clonorchis sinensis TaxID=79923 RepID=A0A8T1MWL5_CLOSI|nr:hypothetical protein CSKR_201843 [Clonorchis sinensis]